VYSRPTPPSIKRIAARSVLVEVAELLEGMRPENIEVTVSADAALCVEADPDQLRQVIWNLAVNGLEAMPMGGQLVLGASGQPGDPPQGPASARRNVGRQSVREAAVRVAIGVSDTGEGMSPAVQERLFEPFFTTKRAGTGLGLATVYRIAESHGGSVEIDSELGAGTRIRVWLPGVQENR
jgi:two-component system sensor histidine kinase PilS (NtrC family)